MKQKLPKIKRKGKCVFCHRHMKMLWKIADPNLNMGEDIDWFKRESWWYVCRSCKGYIMEKQMEGFYANIIIDYLKKMKKKSKTKIGLLELSQKTCIPADRIEKIMDILPGVKESVT